MEKGVLVRLLCAGALVALSSCSQPSPYVRVIMGNNSFSRGDYQQANIEYIKALDAALGPEWISYNIGNVYYALGEAEAASAEWLAAADTDSEELLFRIVFNQGALEFELGRYDRAYAYFRNALELVPDSLAAKINLEYSLDKMDAKPREQEPRESEPETDNERSSEIERILDYLRRKEEQVWKSTEEIREESGAPDW